MGIRTPLERRADRIARIVRPLSLPVVLVVLVSGLAQPGSAAPSARTPSIRSLPLVYPAIGHQTLHLSADGTTVVGTVQRMALSFEAVRWTGESGWVPLGGIWNGSQANSTGDGISGDGSVVVGSGSADSGNWNRAIRWSSQHGWEALGDLPGGEPYSVASAASDDGSVVVGYGSGPAYTQAMRWTAATGMVAISPLHSSATDVSADGSVVVGRMGDQLSWQAFRWTEATGAVGLGDLGNDAFRSMARAVTPDGSVIAGTGSPEGTQVRLEAFRWTESTGMVPLGYLPGGTWYSVATAISGDGNLIVGVADEGGATVGFVWTDEGGMVSANTYLSQRGVALDGWTLSSVTDVSRDGNTFAGFGESPSGFMPWVAWVPEPGMGMMTWLAMGSVKRRRRWPRRGGV